IRVLLEFADCLLMEHQRVCHIAAGLAEIAFGPERTAIQMLKAGPGCARCNLGGAQNLFSAFCAGVCLTKFANILPDASDRAPDHTLDLSLFFLPGAESFGRGKHAGILLLSLVKFE